MRKILFGLAILTMVYSAGSYLVWLMPPKGDQRLPVFQFSELQDWDDLGALGVLEKGKWGFLNEKGKLVIEPRFSSKIPAIYAFLFERYQIGWKLFLAGEEIEGETKWGWIDRNGDFVISPEWEDAEEFNEQGVAPVSKGGKWGLIDRDGNLVGALLGDRAHRLDEHGLIPVRVDEHWGWVDQNGDFQVPAKFAEAFDFDDEGMALVKQGGLWGWVDREGQYVIKSRWWHALPFDNHGLALVSRPDLPKASLVTRAFEELKGHQCWIDRTGNVVINHNFVKVLANVGESLATNGYIEFEFVHHNQMLEALGELPDDIFFDGNNGLVAVQDGDTEKWGFFNRKGELVVPFEWDRVEPFGEHGLAPVRRDGMIGWINTSGELVIPPIWSDGRGFDARGMAPVSRFGKWGWIDTKGEVVILPRWDATSGFGDGDFSVVELDEKEGIVDREGNVVLQPKWSHVYAEDGAESWWVGGDYDETNYIFQEIIRIGKDGALLTDPVAGLVRPDAVPGYDFVAFSKELGRAEIWMAKFRNWLDSGNKSEIRKQVIEFRWLNSKGEIIWESGKLGKEWSLGGIFAVGLLFALLARPKRIEAGSDIERDSSEGEGMEERSR